MNLNNFTIKAQEIVQQAQQLAFNDQSPAIETAHLLKALLKDMADEGLIDSAPGRAFHQMGGVPKVTVLRIVDVDDSGLRFVASCLQFFERVLRDVVGLGAARCVVIGSHCVSPYLPTETGFPVSLSIASMGMCKTSTASCSTNSSSCRTHTLGFDVGRSLSSTRVRHRTSIRS